MGLVVSAAVLEISCQSGPWRGRQLIAWSRRRPGPATLIMGWWILASRRSGD